jgi:molecular chaperone IbpA
MRAIGRSDALAAEISATHIFVVQAPWAARERSDGNVDPRMSLNQGGHAMRTFDLAPLYRSTVGFDRLFSLLDQVAGVDAAPSYPPYNIERTGENAYRITLAVAGFTEADLSIEAKEDTLTIRGEKQAKNENSGEVLYQGIAARAFERRFQLADHVEVKGATLENGLLHVDLVREIPETLKPRQIPIGTQSAKVIDANTAKAA